MFDCEKRTDWGEKGKGLILSLLVVVLLPTVSSNFLLATFEKQC